jgi:lambda family phage portal protein
LSTPPLKSESLRLRDGVELDRYGEPIAYHIREAHPADFIHDPRSYQWKRVRRRTRWGRAIALHIFDHGRAEMTRGVSEFATAIVPMKMLARYNDTELQSAIIQASYAAVIESELDYSDALAAIGADKFKDAKNPITKMALDHLESITPYHKEMGITFNGAKIAHLPPNEKLHMMGSNHPNGNFDKFEGAFLRRFAAGLGVENHELSKNYADLNYSAARTALAAVWRSYQARREKSVKAFAMPFFGAWMEEAWATGRISLPGKITDFHAYKPALVRGTFIGNGKPLIDPVKERKGQQIGMAMGAETLEDVCARDGQNWRDNLEQIAYERRVRAEYGLPEPIMEGEKRQQETTEGEGAKE